MEEKLRELESPDPAEMPSLVANDVPFVVRGLCRDWPALAKWDFDYLSRKLPQTPGKVYKAWFRSREGALAEDIPTKETVKRILYQDGNFPIAENMAIWMSAKSNVTTLHYDGYSYDGFNVQVTGRKTFRLFHPDLACVMAPFTQGALPDAKDAEAQRRVTSYTVELNPGDCLFTPRFWYHTVRAETDATNVQYHFARKAPPTRESRAMRHYINNCWLVAHVPYLIPRGVRAGISEYPDIVGLYATRARWGEALAQAASAMLRMSGRLLVSPVAMTRLMRRYDRRSVEELSKLM